MINEAVGDKKKKKVKYTSLRYIIPHNHKRCCSLLNFRPVVSFIPSSSQPNASACSLAKKQAESGNAPHLPQRKPSGKGRGNK